MSEFSKSVHLRGDRPNDAAVILSTAKVPGYVLPASNGWVTSLPQFDWGTERLDRIVEVSRDAPLLLWDYAEDHGVWVTVYEGSAVRARIEVSFETQQRAIFDRDAFLELGWLTPADADDIERWLDARRPGYLIAQRLGLPHYAWASFAAAERQHAAGRLRDALVVDKEGLISSTESQSESESEGVAPSPWDALANAVLRTWCAAGLVQLQGSAPSAALVDGLADLLASEPTPTDLETFLFEHDEVEEVFAAPQILAGGVALAIRQRRARS